MIDPTVGLLLAPPGEDGGGGIFVLILNFGLIFLIFYWLLIRPQKKERQRHKEMIEGLRKGDQIIMNGGIIGSIIHLADDRLTIKTAENTRLEVDRSSVASKLNDEAGS